MFHSNHDLLLFCGGSHTMTQKLLYLFIDSDVFMQYLSLIIGRKSIRVAFPNLSFLLFQE